MYLEQLLTQAIGTFFALLPIANPVGAVPLFHSLTAVDSPPARHEQALQISINVIWVLALFFLSGRLILEFFNLSLGVLRIAGGLLVAHTAWEMVAVRPRLTSPEREEAYEKEDIAFTPMAVPMLSGPGAIGVVMGLSGRASHLVDYVGSLVGIVLLGMSVFICLELGEMVLLRMGKTGIGALNRVLGFLILAIAVQFIAEGIFAFIQSTAPGLLD